MTRSRSSARGQMLVIFAGGLVAIIVAVGLVVDVGYAWAQQRATQNGADSAAKAGAVVLGRRAAEGPSSTVTDEDVRNAVFANASANGVTVNEAQYTDYQGTLLGSTVGGGSIPANAAGVQAITQRTPRTFLIGVVGITQWTINQAATAVSGPTAGCPDTFQGCILLPVTIPVSVFACTNTGRSDPVDPPQTWTTGQKIVLPLCGGNPGSVGWLDWTPPAGGASEVADVIANPPPVNIPLPSWQYITETGDISALPVENAINDKAGEIALIPFFADTCADEPPDLRASACPSGPATGMGQNQWYWITKFLAFELDSPRAAYINGNNEAVCGLNAKECLVGTFVTFITEGNVGAPCPPSGCPEGTAFAVQLIK